MSCGRSLMVVQKNTQAVEALPVGTEPPRIGRALTVGWKTIRQDPKGVLLVTLGFILILGLISAGPLLIVMLIDFQLEAFRAVIACVVLFLSGWAMLTFFIGYIGWADARRTGQRPGLSYIFKTTRNNLWDSLQWSFSYLIIIIAIWLTVQGINMAIPPQPLPEETGGFREVLGILFSSYNPVSFLPLIILRPLIFIITGLSGWAIAKGVKFNESVLWAVRRISSNFFLWYFSGVILFSCDVFGYITLLLGYIITMPFVFISVTELASQGPSDVENHPEDV